MTIEILSAKLLTREDAAAWQDDVTGQRHGAEASGHVPQPRLAEWGNVVPAYGKGFDGLIWGRAISSGGRRDTVIRSEGRSLAQRGLIYASEFLVRDGSRLVRLQPSTDRPLTVGVVWWRRDTAFEEAESFSIIVGSAAEDISDVIHQAPVVVEDRYLTQWLDHRVSCVLLTEHIPYGTYDAEEII